MNDLAGVKVTQAAENLVTHKPDVLQSEPLSVPQLRLECVQILCIAREHQCSQLLIIMIEVEVVLELGNVRAPTLSLNRLKQLCLFQFCWKYDLF